MTIEKTSLVLDPRSNKKIFKAGLNNVSDIKLIPGMKPIKGEASDIFICLEGELGFFNPQQIPLVGTVNLYSCICLIATSNDPRDGLIIHCTNPSLAKEDHSLSKAFKQFHGSDVFIRLIGGGVNRSEVVLNWIYEQLAEVAKEKQVTIVKQHVLERNKFQPETDSSYACYHYILTRAEIFSLKIFGKPLNRKKIAPYTSKVFDSVNTNFLTQMLCNVYLGWLKNVSPFKEDMTKCEREKAREIPEEHFYSGINALFSRKGFKSFHEALTKKNIYSDSSLCHFLYNLKEESVQRIYCLTPLPYESLRRVALFDKANSKDFYQVVFNHGELHPPELSDSFKKFCKEVPEGEFTSQQLKEKLTTKGLIDSELSFEAGLFLCTFLKSADSQRWLETRPLDQKLTAIGQLLLSGPADIQRRDNKAEQKVISFFSRPLLFSGSIQERHKTDKEVLLEVLVGIGRPAAV